MSRKTAGFLIRHSKKLFSLLLTLSLGAYANKSNGQTLEQAHLSLFGSTNGFLTLSNAPSAYSLNAGERFDYRGFISLIC
ncbi:MAG: hypothetical protein ACOVOO_07735 [Flavobacteriales bacterium]|jgi:hypothetical protein